MTAFYQTKKKSGTKFTVPLLLKIIKLLYYAVTHCEAPAVLYNLTARSCTSSGACAVKHLYIHQELLNPK